MILSTDAALGQRPSLVMILIGSRDLDGPPQEELDHRLTTPYRAVVVSVA